MSAGAGAGKHRMSQSKLNGERGASLEPLPSQGMFGGERLLTPLLAASPISRAHREERQKQKKYWNGDIQDIHF